MLMEINLRTDARHVGFRRTTSSNLEMKRNFEFTFEVGQSAHFDVLIDSLRLKLLLAGKLTCTVIVSPCSKLSSLFSSPRKLKAARAFFDFEKTINVFKS